MFARNRSEAKTRGQLFRDEMSETFDHALRAAGHAASGIRATRAGHTAGRVRDATVRGWGSTKAALAPLNEAAQTKVKDMKAARNQRGPGMKRRWPVLAGLLAGGAAVGAAGAMLLRRRRQQWEGYEPGEEESVELGGASDELPGDLPDAPQPAPNSANENNKAADPAQAVAGD